MHIDNNCKVERLVCVMESGVGSALRRPLVLASFLGTLDQYRIRVLAGGGTSSSDETFVVNIRLFGKGTRTPVPTLLKPVEWPKIVTRTCFEATRDLAKSD